MPFTPQDFVSYQTSEVSCKAVYAAYDWPSDLSDEEILERLLRLNLERAGRG